MKKKKKVKEPEKIKEEPTKKVKEPAKVKEEPEKEDENVKEQPTNDKGE